MNLTDGLTRADLLAPFRPAGPQEQMGIEVECATLDAATGCAAPYEGPNGTSRLLHLILEEEGGEPIFGSLDITGIQLEDGAKVTLEAGGALEYSSRPVSDLVTLTEEMHCFLGRFAEQASALGLALVPAGNLPFNTLSDVEWIPDAHVSIMRGFCERLGEPGIASMEVSTLAITTQTTLSHCSESDLTKKVRTAFAAAAVAAALFVNSPLYNGQPSGLLSWRMSRLLHEDPSRFGLPQFAMREDIAADHFIDWLLGLPMIHRSKDGHPKPAPDRTFSQLLTDGFEDGSWPTVVDWQSQTSQAWPFVRLRKTIELRLSDGPPYASIPAAPAFWTGLLYHPPSLDAAWRLLRGRTVQAHLRTIEDVATRGLAAKHGEEPVAELAGELLDLAAQGLQARVATGRERPDVMRYLEPLYELVDSRETFAQQLLRRWEADLRRSPQRLVAAYRI